MKKCEIIIPIYNAYDSVVNCVESVLRNTNLEQNSLILINDKSTDEKIIPYLEKIYKKGVKEKFNIKIINNEENLGFVKTVNRGMKISSNDVLLLNSDTEVSEGWLEKIKKCAYSDVDVATVTPLSNNATLVSVPNCLQNNNYNEYDLKTFNETLEKINEPYYELPTGQGFCLFIKREVIDEVGYFDEETFERGYGEENDFCYRCLDYGYRHLLCTDTIVYHKESQSFKKEKNEVISKHLDILKKRYPVYCEKTDLWLKELPIRNFANRIYYTLNFTNGKPNILILIHDWETKTGGTTLHVRDLISGLSDKYNFVILYKSNLNEGYALTTITDQKEKTIYLKNIFDYSDYSFKNDEYESILSNIVVDFNISIVHVHHMKYHYFNILRVAKKYNIKTIITLHDFYCLCPTINMLENGNDCCINKKNKECKNCMKKLKNINNNIINIWQKNWHYYLKQFDYIITPSNDTKKYIEKYYDGLKIRTVEHGIEMKKSNYIPTLDNKINVAMIGVLCNHKGGNILNKLVNYNNTKIFYHCFGYSEIEEMKKNRKNYIYHGLYKRENLQKILMDNNINLICFFQKWPETYSYTLNEAISAGIPVLSFDIGAGAERIKKYNFGWTIDINSTISEINDKINDVVSDKVNYEEKIDSIKKYNIKNIDQMCCEYDKLYNNTTEISNKKFIYKFENLNNIILPSENELEKLNEILNSTKWKLVNKIKIPKKIVFLVRKLRKSGD